MRNFRRLFDRRSFIKLGEIPTAFLVPASFQASCQVCHFFGKQYQHANPRSAVLEVTKKVLLSPVYTVQNIEQTDFTRLQAIEGCFASVNHRPFCVGLQHDAASLV